MALNNLRNKLNSIDLSPQFATIIQITSVHIIATGISPSIGDVVKIIANNSDETLGLVSQIEKENFTITPFALLDGLSIGDKIYLNSKGMNVGVGYSLLGRVVNPLINPLDSLGEINFETTYPMNKEPIPALKRDIIKEPMPTGVKAIDSCLTCGKGQKIGIFAGSGVGKSTLMSMIVKGTSAKIKVIALIGERGREVKEFIEHNLDNNLENVVIVAVTSDDSPIMRKYGAFAAMSIAEYFKDMGEDVLLIMDSVTRFAMAQREISLALKEPPTSKGYTSSTLTLLPKLMERAGGEVGKGSITAFFTILVDGDDMRDPVADQSRSILDGHIVLDREIVQSGIYPPINILESASRVIGNVLEKENINLANKLRRLLSTLKENEVLVRIGAYVKGNDDVLDEALEKKDEIMNFLSQDKDESVNFEDSLSTLKAILE